MALSTDITGFYGYSIVALFGNLGYKFNITEVMEKIVDAFNLIMVYRRFFCSSLKRLTS